jgi:glycogen debranching enzyme
MGWWNLWLWSLHPVYVWMLVLGAALMWSFIYWLRVSRYGRILCKLHAATGVMHELVGKRGIWASSVRYRHQCWTRDSCLAVFWPFLHFIPLRNRNLVRQHLMNLAKQQRSDGRIPIVFQDDPTELMRHLTQIERDQQRAPYALRQLRQNNFEYITEHTRDSETLFIATTLEYFSLFNLNEEEQLMKGAVIKAMDYIAHRIPKDKDTGLILGGDWRDTSTELNHKPVLSNAVLLWRTYQLAGHGAAADKVKETIQKQYWNNSSGYFCNYPASYATNDRFVPVFEGQTMVRWGGCDRLGNALCILFDIASPGRAERILTYLFNHSRTSVGIDIGGVYLSPKNDVEKKIIMQDRTVIWPWIHNLITLASHHHLTRILKDKSSSTLSMKTVESLLDQSTAIDGFPEWCSIHDRTGYGSPNQTWSAATYIRLCQTLYPTLTQLYSTLHLL